MPLLTIIATMVLGGLMIAGLASLLSISPLWILGASLVGVLATLVIADPQEA